MGWESRAFERPSPLLLALSLPYREHARLSHAQQHAQPIEMGGRAHAGKGDGGGAPRRDEEGEPPPRADAQENEIRRDLQRGVAHEEDGRAGAVDGLGGERERGGLSAKMGGTRRAPSSSPTSEKPSRSLSWSAAYAKLERSR